MTRPHLIEHRFLHVAMRARGRFDISLDRTDYARLCELIASGRLGEGVPVPSRPDSVEYQLRLKGKNVVAVWRKAEQLVVTLFPPKEGT